MADDTGLVNHSEPRLTLEAERAIRTYLLWWVIPIAGLFSAFTGISGYFIRDVAQLNAENRAFAAAQTQISAMIQDAERRRSQIQHMAEEVERIKKAIEINGSLAKKFGDDIDDLELKLASSKAFQTSDPQIKKIAELIAEDPRIRNAVQAITEVVQKKLETIKIDVRDRELSHVWADVKVKFGFPVKHAWIEYQGNWEPSLKVFVSEISGDCVIVKCDWPGVPKGAQFSNESDREQFYEKKKSYRVWATSF